jgi:hypothetical protein
MNKKKLGTLFDTLIIAVSFIGLILNFTLFTNFSGILYYTILSNLFVLIFYLSTIILQKRNKNYKTENYYMLRGLMLLSILSTMLIYNFMLSTTSSIYKGHNIICSIVHIVVPLLVLFDCLYFQDKKVLKYKYLLFWSLFLAIYFVVINIYGLMGGNFLNGKSFPYAFLDISNYGLKLVFIKCVLILVFYLILGLIIVFVDNKMAVINHETK